MIFTPSPNLNPTTSYTVKVGTSAQSTLGVSLQTEFSSTFVTGSTTESTPPAVNTIGPVDGSNNVSLSTPFVITFSEPMNTFATKGAFSTSPSMVGAVGWSNGDTVLTFTPSPEWNESTVYTVALQTSTTDIAGNALLAPFGSTFTTGNFNPPSDVSNFATTSGLTGEINLAWVNPVDADFAGVRILRRDDGFFPTDENDGIVVFDGLATSHTDTGLTNSVIYNYTIFAYDGTPNFSNGVKDSTLPGF